MRKRNNNKNELREAVVREERYSSVLADMEGAHIIKLLKIETVKESERLLAKKQDCKKSSNLLT